MTEDIYGDDLLDELETWFGRFILPTDTEDLALMASWTLHTHVVRECFTTPRLLVDSTLPGSGKRPCWNISADCAARVSKWR